MPRPCLTDAERRERRRAGWDRVLNGQRRPGSVPGSPEDWVRTFRERFGLVAEIAAGPVDAALAYFGLRAGADFAAIRSAFRRRVRQVHPDCGGTDEETRRCLSYFEAIKRRLG